MAVQDTNVVDIVAHYPQTDSAALCMVEVRPWGESGALLPDLQAKFNTYLEYALGGQMVRDYPALADKPVHFELRTAHAPTPREEQFLDIVVRQHLQPRGITFQWHLLGSSQTPPAKKPWWKLF